MPSIKVTIGVVPFMAVKYLPYSMKSLMEQDYDNLEILVLDQEEGKFSSAKWIRENQPEWLNKMTLMEGPNLWHSGGMNKLMAMSTGDVFVVASLDMLYPKDFARKIAEFFEQNPQYDFVAPRLMRWDFVNLKTTDQVDSMGIQISTTHAAYEIDQTHIFEPKSLEKKIVPVMGVSGALMALRKSIIEKVQFKGEIFDQNLHYKNDVDLVYRLAWLGSSGAVINDLVVYHDRFISKKSKKPFWVKKQSLFGDLLFTYKNFSWQYSWSTKLKTIIYLMAKTLFLVVTNPKLIFVFQDLKKQWPKIKEWRKALKREITPAQMEQKLRGTIIVEKT